MDWIDSLNSIRNAQQNNQLVIFVGAGVSINSKMPSWEGLIRQIAERISYNKCDYCKKAESCPIKNTSASCDFTQEEYLRIPEYFYNYDTSEDHKEYYNFIRRSLESKNKPNAIDDEIVRILPHHIITTNYDHLLEESTEDNSALFSVVCKDKDLLSNGHL